MKQHTTKLLTIYTEAALETRLIDDLERHGALGYTITNARGKGSRGQRSASWEANSNIRIEIICSDELASALAQYLFDQYYSNYAMVSFIVDIQVLRHDKFEP